MARLYPMLKRASMDEETMKRDGQVVVIKRGLRHPRGTCSAPLPQKISILCGVGRRGKELQEFIFGWKQTVVFIDVTESTSTQKSSETWTGASLEEGAGNQEDM